MNKGELISAVAKKAGMTMVDTEKILNAEYDIIAKTLAKGKGEEKVQITGFGSYSISWMNPRKGVNPKNPKEELDIPGGYRIFFSAGKKLKDVVNNRIEKKNDASKKKNSKKDEKKKDKKKSKKK
jgi:nucleoid DNA-binding protein